MRFTRFDNPADQSLARRVCTITWHVGAAVIRTGAAVLVLLGGAAPAALATTTPTVPVPEPGMLVLIGSGVASAVLYARNRRR